MPSLNETHSPTFEFYTLPSVPRIPMKTQILITQQPPPPFGSRPAPSQMTPGSSGSYQPDPGSVRGGAAPTDTLPVAPSGSLQTSSLTPLPAVQGSQSLGLPSIPSIPHQSPSQMTPGSGGPSSTANQFYMNSMQGESASTSNPPYGAKPSPVHQAAPKLQFVAGQAYTCKCIVDIAGNGCFVQSATRVPDGTACACGSTHGSTAN